MKKKAVHGNANKKQASIRDRNSAISDVLFFSIGEGAIVIDERGNIARVNKVACDMLGFTAKELLGKWFQEAVRAEDENGNLISNIDRPVTEVFLTGKPVFRRVYYIRKDGHRLPVALTVSPVLLGDKPIGAIELFRDITEELQLEHAKDEFISIASHQLRTPATVVKQYLGMILDGYVSPGKQQTEMLKLAYEHNDNQLNIISDLLKVALAEANKIVPIRKKTNIVLLLQKIIDSQKPEYDKRSMEIHLEAKEKSIVCRFDPLHMQMVFENLINNANKYSPDNTKVVISVIPSDSEVIIRVADQGIGISPNDMPKLFKKFSRAENVNSTASGTGLGLYWAKKLVQLHKGDISVESVLGKGTVFIVRLPRDGSE